jgi:hypothetical protein
VPAGAPVGFVPTRWAGYLTVAAGAGDTTAYRRYREIAVLVGLRDGLRSGDVYVPGARRYAGPASFLLTAEAWAPAKLELCLPRSAARGGRRRAGPADDELAAMLPRVQIASVLIEVDARTEFTAELLHAGRKVNRAGRAQTQAAPCDHRHHARTSLLATRRVNTDLITGMWTTCCASRRAWPAGTPRPPRWSASCARRSGGRTPLTSAIKKYGALRRTVYVSATWPTRLPVQDRPAVQQGKNLHALSRSLAYAGEGALRRRHREQQTEQMWRLTLATNAIVCWSTEYHGLDPAALRGEGRDVDDEVLARIWPTHHENMHFYGTHSGDIDGELALDADGSRPPRVGSRTLPNAGTVPA